MENYFPAYSLYRHIFLCLIILLQACTQSPMQNHYRSQIKIGEQIIKNGERQIGNKILNHVQSSQHNNGDASLALAQSYYDQAIYLKANIEYDRAIAQGEYTEGLIGKGRVALAQNKPEIAIFHFQNALKNATNAEHNLIIHNGIGVAYDLQGMHKRARQEYQFALTYDQNYMPVWNNIALSYAFSGNPNEALDLMAQVFKTNVDDRKFRENFAFIQLISNQYDTAKVAYQGILSDEQIYENQIMIDSLP